MAVSCASTRKGGKRNGLTRRTAHSKAYMSKLCVSVNTIFFAPNILKFLYCM